MGCRVSKEKSSLIRIVNDKSQGLTVDRDSKMNGRGVYVCNEASCVQRFIRTRACDKAYKQSFSKEAYDRLGQLLLEK